MDLTDFIETELTDFQFAGWLNEQGGLETFEHYLNTVRWFGLDKKIIAIGIYDNSRCTRRLFLRKGLVDVG